MTMAGQPTPPKDTVPIAVALSADDLAALDGYADRLGEPKPSRAELIRRILVDRLVHEDLLPASRAYTGHSAKCGLRPDQLSAENDD